LSISVVCGANALLHQFGWREVVEGSVPFL